MLMRNQIKICFVLSLLIATRAISFTWADTNTLELGAIEVVPLREQTRVQDPTTLATVLDQQALKSITANTLADITGTVPGLTWAGGTTRARYLQMRGIGEVSQFPGEGPPNFSVGLIFDEMDFSGLGLPASLFDVAEIEILRGPQATIYGSRAMAGLVHVRSMDPTPYHERRIQAGVGSDNYLRGAIAISGPLSRNPETLQLRLVFESEQQDGFRENTFLNRDDTNQRDEKNYRLKLRWQPTENLKVDISTLYVDFQNGYDQFTPDNDPTQTYSDKPGKDTQKGGGGALRLSWDGLAAARLLSITSFMKLDSIYSFDADWGNDAFWAASPYFWDPAVQGYAYDFFEKLDRTRRTFSQDIRFLSHPGQGLLNGRLAWQAGAHVIHLNEKDDSMGFAPFQSTYEANSGAMYLMGDTQLDDGWSLHTGVRIEQRETDYQDNQDVSAERSDTMWGGRISLARKIAENWRMHSAISRGFKGSGVNQNPALPENRRSYEAEVLWNIETGLAADFQDLKLYTQLTAFYMLRDNLQIGTSAQFDPTDPTAFVYFTDNAAKGFNRGIEWTIQQRPLERIQLSGTLSLLDSEYDDFTAAGGVNPVNGREQPFSPTYSYQAAIQAQIWKQLYGRIELEGQDDIYLAAGHNGQAEAYELVHLQAGWETETWAVTARIRNIFDKDYVTQGYQFGLEPPDFAEKRYVTYGDPIRFDIVFDATF